MMGIKNAYEALTTPTPTGRQFLIAFAAERLVKRHAKKAPVSKNDVWWLIVVMSRWGIMTKTEMPSLSREAVGRLADDIYDAAKIMAVEGL